MSDEEQTLTDQDVGGAGVEKRQGYPPMPMTHPDPAPDLTDFTPDESFGPKEAGEFIARRREEAQQERPPSEAEPEVRAYVHQGGEKSGEPRPSRETVPIQRVVSDLTAAREAEGAAKITALEADLLNQLDSEAADRVQSTEPRHQPNAVEPEPPRLDGAVGERADKLTRLFQENPELLETVQAYQTQSQEQVAQTQQQAVQYTQAVQQQYVNELAATSAQALQLFAAKYPALAGLQTADQIRGAIAAMDHQAPEQAAQLRADINIVTQVAGKAQEAQQQQMQAAQNQYRAQFAYVAQHADNAFDSWAQTQDTPEQVRAISDHARQLLRSEGLSDAQVNHLWQNDGLFRSVTGQKILYLASKASLSMAGARSKAVRPVPTVQRPAGGHRGSEADWNLGRLSAQLDRDQSAKSAAALLTARRNASRR